MKYAQFTTANTSINPLESGGFVIRFWPLGHAVSRERLIWLRPEGNGIYNIKTDDAELKKDIGSLQLVVSNALYKRNQTQGIFWHFVGTTGTQVRISKEPFEIGDES